VATTTPTPARAPATPAPAPKAPVARREGLLVAGLREAGDLTAFSGAAVRATAVAPRFASEALRHAKEMILGTSLMLFIMSGFIGISIANATYFLLRALGASDYLGLISGYVVPRQVTAGMFGYVFTAKVCCGMTSTLGAMRINQEIDALDSTGVDPLQYVVGTRIIATILFIPLATTLCLLGSFLGAYLEGVVVLGGIAGSSLTAVHWSVQSVNDQLFALASVTAIALSSVLVACFYGLRTRGGPDAVGRAVSRSLSVNLVLQHVIASVFVVLFYGSNIRLPIAGG
jgi:phospholipid/cholesterol/gamma-HCH transport system permease protein